MISIYVRLCQKKGPFLALRKLIELPIVPPPGSWFEYQTGWPLAYLGTDLGELNLLVSSDGVTITGYGPQFSEDEIERLIENHGWEGRVA